MSNTPSRSFRSVIAATIIAGSGLAVMASPVQALIVNNFENITPNRGFGSGLNKYSWSSSTFTGADINTSIYVGTLNHNFDFFALPQYISQITDPQSGGLAAFDAFRRIWSGSPVTPSTGGEIWRYKNNIWEQVHKADAQDVGFRDMAQFQGRLYAGTANGPDGPAPGDAYYKALPFPPNPPITVNHGPGISGTALFRSDENGENWQEVTGGPGLNPLNASNRTMVEIGGRLYVGTENPISGPELWSYDGTTWTFEAQLKTGPFPRGLAIGEIAEGPNGEILLGTWGSGGGFELLELGPPIVGPGLRTVIDRTPTNIPDLGGNSGVMEMRVFNGQFYLGTLDYGGGFSLMRNADPQNPGDWELVTGDGFETEFAGMGGTSNNAYPWASAVIDGVYYLTTFQTNREDSPLDLLLGTDVPLDGRGQLWYSLDGLNWKIIEGNGFDSLFTYGFRTLTELDGELVVGTASNLFFPDFLSPPYTDFLEEFIAYLIGMDDPEMLELAGMLSSFETILDPLFEKGLLPYIGTQVFVSNTIPEPGSLLVLGTGVVGLIIARRRRKRTA